VTTPRREGVLKMAARNGWRHVLARWQSRVAAVLAVGLVLILATTTIALARVDGDGGPWHAAASAPYTPPAEVDQASRVLNAYDDAHARYAPYTPAEVGQPSGALLRWNAYDEARTPPAP